METFLELLKYTIPGLVVFATAYYLLKLYLDDRLRYESAVQRREALKLTLPLPWHHKISDPSHVIPNKPCPRCRKAPLRIPPDPLSSLHKTAPSGTMCLQMRHEALTRRD